MSLKYGFSGKQIHTVIYQLANSYGYYIFQVEKGVATNQDIILKLHVN